MTEPKQHDGETLAEARDRFSDNLEDPFDEHRKSRGRMGWRDTIGGHSAINVLVAWCRELPREAGHMMAYLILALVVICVGLVVWSLL